MTTEFNTEARVNDGLFSLKTMYTLWQQTLDLVFPPCCQYCRRVDHYFCDTCQQDLLSVPIEVVASGNDSSISIVSSGYHEGLLQAAVQSLKYNGQRHLGYTLAKRLVSVLNQVNWTFDMVIPVPLHFTRLQKRGYNQAREISIHLAELIHYEHAENLIIRQKYTQSQVTLSREERILNVKEAFEIQSTTYLEGRTVLLVDDVQTTGATLNACAEAILSGGATHVYGITVTAARSQN